MLPPLKKSAKSWAMRRWLAKFCILAVATLSLTLAETGRADEPEPIHRYEDDRRPPHHVRPKLLLTGVLFTGVFYAPALGASYLFPDHEGATQMRIPVAGPWMAFSKTKLCNARPELDPCSNFLQVTGAVLLVLDGIGQAGGVALVLQSLFMRTGPSRAVRGGDSETSLYSAEAMAAAFVPDVHAPRQPERLLTFSRGDFQMTAVPYVTSETSLGFGLAGRF